MPEEVPNDEDSSRLLFAPLMEVPNGELVWQNVFQFQSKYGCCESLVWRRYAPTIADVHAIGCGKQWADRAAERTQTYTGALTANIGVVRNLRSLKGGRFLIEQVPDEGEWHLHICFDQAHSLTRNDKTELKKHIKDAFAERSGHTCPDEAA